MQPTVYASPSSRARPASRCVGLSLGGARRGTASDEGTGAILITGKRHLRHVLPEYIGSLQRPPTTQKSRSTATEWPELSGLAELHWGPPAAIDSADSSTNTPGSR
jgi:hypothetical protein